MVLPSVRGWVDNMVKGFNGGKARSRSRRRLVGEGGSPSSAIVHLFKSRILFKSAGMNWELGEVDCGLTFNGAEVACVGVVFIVKIITMKAVLRRLTQ